MVIKLASEWEDNPSCLPKPRVIERLREEVVTRWAEKQPLPRRLNLYQHTQQGMHRSQAYKVRAERVLKFASYFFLILMGKKLELQWRKDLCIHAIPKLVPGSLTPDSLLIPLHYIAPSHPPPL